MCLSADEIDPLCDDCLAQYKAATKKGIELKDKDMCEACRDLPSHFCFCCYIDQRACEGNLDIVQGVCKYCRKT